MPRTSIQRLLKYGHHKRYDKLKLLLLCKSQHLSLVAKVIYSLSDEIDIS